MDNATDSPVVNLNGAARILQTSREKVRRLIADGELSGFESVLDRRSRFVRLADVQALKARDLQPINTERMDRRQAPAA